MKIHYFNLSLPSRSLVLIGLGIFLCGCELLYDPVKTGDAPRSPATKVPQQFTYREKVAPVFTAEELQNTMPLGKLLDIALSNNPLTRASWNAARAAAYGYHVALAEYYPSIEYSGFIQAEKLFTGSTLTNSTSPTVTVPTNAAKALTTPLTVPATHIKTNSNYNELTLYYLLLDFGGRYGNASLAFQTLVAANWQHNEVMQSVMLSVINAYTQYVSNKSLVAATELDLQDAQTALDSSILMHKWGVATQTDILSSQSLLEQIRYNLEQAKGAEKTAEKQLLIALGLPVSTRISVENLPEKLPVVEISEEIGVLIDLAKQRNPTIGVAIAEVREQEANLLISFSAGMPVFTLTGVASRQNFTNPYVPRIDENIITLNLNAPLFSGFYYTNLVKQMKAQVDEAIANLDAQVSTVVSNVVVNYYAFKTAEAALASSEATLDYSQRSYEGTFSQYKVGSSSMLDVVNSLTILSNARAQQIATRTQWAYSLANLAFSVGILTEDSGMWMDGPPKRLYDIKYKDNSQ